MGYDQGQSDGKLDQLCTPFKEAHAAPIPMPGDKGDLAATTGGFDIPDGQKDSHPGQMPYVTTVNLKDGAKRGESFETAIDTFKGTIHTK